MRIRVTNKRTGRSNVIEAPALPPEMEEDENTYTPLDSMVGGTPGEVAIPTAERWAGYGKGILEEIAGASGIPTSFREVMEGINPKDIAGRMARSPISPIKPAMDIYDYIQGFKGEEQKISEAEAPEATARFITAMAGPTATHMFGGGSELLGEGLGSGDIGKALRGGTRLALGGGMVAGLRSGIKGVKPREIPPVEPLSVESIKPVVEAKPTEPPLGSSFEDILGKVDEAKPVEYEPFNVPSKVAQQPQLLLDKLPEPLQKPARDFSTNLARGYELGKIDDVALDNAITNLSPELKSFAEILKMDTIIRAEELHRGRLSLDAARGRWNRKAKNLPDGEHVMDRIIPDPQNYDIIQVDKGKIVGYMPIRDGLGEHYTGGPNFSDTLMKPSAMKTLAHEKGARHSGVYSTFGAESERAFGRRFERERIDAESRGNIGERVAEPELEPTYTGIASKGPGEVESIKGTRPIRTSGTSERITEIERDLAYRKKLGIYDKVKDTPALEEELAKLKSPVANLESEVLPPEPIGGRGPIYPTSGSTPNFIGPVEPPTPPQGPIGPSPKIPPISDLPVHSYKDWMNARAAKEIDSRIIKKKFEPLNLTLDDAIAYQKGGLAARPDFKDVKSYTDSRLWYSKKTGIPVREKLNYIPQYWEQNPKIVKEVARRLGIRPGYSMESIFPDYQTGIDAGLTPKYSKLSDILERYEGDVRKATADRKFFNFLKVSKMISTTAKSGWEMLDPKHFTTARYRVKGGKKVSRQYYAPKEVADIINNYLQEDKGFLAEKYIPKATDVKNVVMSSGVPFTSLNAHGFSIMGRALLASKNPVTAIPHVVKFLVNKNSARRVVESNLKNLSRYVKAGGVVGVEDHPFGLMQSIKEAKGEFGYKKLRAAHRILFEDPLFQNVIPALKAEKFAELEASYKKGGMDGETARTKAAHDTNNLYGGMNWIELGRLRGTQNLFRAIFNAPDWMESQIRVGGKVAGAMRPKNWGKSEYQVYRNIMRNLAVYYVTANAISKVSTGKLLFEGESGFNVPAGETKGGRKRSVRPFSTGADFARIPYEVAERIARGDLAGIPEVLRNRVNPLTSGLVRMVWNIAGPGREILGERVGGKTVPEKLARQGGRVLKEFADVAAPQYVSGPLSALTGEIEPETAVARSLELPLSYKKKKKKKGIAPFMRTFDRSVGAP